MRVLVTASGGSLDAEVDQRFGRAPQFVVVDLESGAVQCVENTQQRNAMQGAGIQSAQRAADLGVQVVITGHCGPKAFHALTLAGIQVVTGAAGKVAQAIDAYKAGALSVAASADVEGHWA